MKTKLFLFIAICMSFAVFSQTPVPEGPISGTWTPAGSPYLVEGETFVIEGTTLTIEPGVLVEWQGSYPMWVYGQILAQGTESDSITFTAANTINGWQGIRFDFTEIEQEDADTSMFMYCKFKYGRVYKASPNNSGGAIGVLDFNKLIVDHCYFTKNTAIVFNVMNPAGGAIAMANSSPIITNSLFVDNLSMSAGAIFCYDGSNPLIENNVFIDNTADGEDQDGQGYGGAIACWIDCDPLIRNNIFYNNYGETGGGAIALVSRCDPSIVQNLIYENTTNWHGGGIELQDTCSAEIINNTIVNNNGDFGGGIHLWRKSTTNITNTIIWGNHAEDGSSGQIYSTTGMGPCIVNLYYSDLLGGWEGIGGFGITGDYDDCIEDIPFFVGSGDHPYQINDNSPCIDAGDPDSEDFDLPEHDLSNIEVRIFNEIIDMGAYEWNPMVGIEEPGTKVLKPVLQCYPNPFSGVTSIEFEVSHPEAIQISFYNQTGKLVEVLKMYSQGGKQTFTWDASDLPSGLYYIQLNSKHETLIQKAIKM